ncbi:Acyl carrier protein [Listeria monocytogenes]|uniref:acyl carrier protein n=1 Tax=Listeria monocytogenes TaxID=1639 RepID=UPI000E749D45|nr:acyl carrier protein [Listeria monocytogenes]RKA27961.1 Acyl carrier protein [Listeria monocytogenes]
MIEQFWDCIHEVLGDKWNENWDLNKTLYKNMKEIGIDSLALVTLVIKLEDKFDIEILDSNIEWLEIRSVSDLYTAILEIKAGGN